MRRVPCGCTRTVIAWSCGCGATSCGCGGATACWRGIRWRSERVRRRRRAGSTTSSSCYSRAGRRFVRAVLVRTVGALECAEAFRRRRRPCRPARDEPAGADRLRRQSRLHPAAERRGATTGENPAARYAGLHPRVVPSTARCLTPAVGSVGLAHLWRGAGSRSTCGTFVTLPSECLTPRLGSVGPGEFGQVEMPLARSSASADSDFSRPSMSMACSTLSVFVNWTSR